MHKVDNKMNIIIIHILVACFIAFIFLSKNRFEFLIVNIILALIPFDWSLAIKYVKNKLVVGISLVAWLIFYPNTMYMITDFSHLSSIGTGLMTASQYFHYSILAVGIFMGVLFGLSSATLVYERLIGKPGLVPQAIFYAVLSVISSAAIYMGRFARLNSVDLLTKFQVTVATMRNVVGHDFYIFVLCFAALQLVLMLVFQISKRL